jgi:sec-independent protein translocase protein TatC
MSYRKLRPVGFEDRLSLVDHLGELRTRIIVSLVALGAIFGLCIWQNDVFLDLINRPLQSAAKSEHKNPQGPLGSAPKQQEQTKELYKQLAKVSESASATVADPQLKQDFSKLSKQAEKSAAAIPASTTTRPITLGVGEPLTVTLQVAFYAALLISLPFLLYQLSAFILPAFSRRERKVVVPVVLSVPVLFVLGAAFGYLVVLPRAITFLQHFNNESFDILLQARDYYRFSLLLLAVMGLVFQIPIVILAITSLRILTPKQLRKNRRYAILVIAIIAMFMPGPDPFSMLLAMVPLILLFEASILLASLLERRRSRARANQLMVVAEDGEEEKAVTLSSHND